MYLLLIDTTTDLCSVALTQDKKIIATLEADEVNAHSTALSELIVSVLQQNKLTVSDLYAVVLSSGPGSYTGLRIGAAMAKGLCFASDIRLVSVSTLQALAETARLAQVNLGQSTSDSLFIPMLDARRMEVYTALFDGEATPLNSVAAVVVEPDFIETITAVAGGSEPHKIILCGNGAEKCLPLLAHRSIEYMTIRCHASNLLSLALKKIERGDFEDIAYYEPFYLKGANITVSTKNR